MTSQGSDGQGKRAVPFSVNDTASWVVLVVDDEADNLTLMTKVLTFKGAKVYTAENGKEGLDVARSTAPSFILLDLAMPIMDGWEMFDALRRDPELCQTPVIALTARAMVGDKERVLERGFDGYISKPFRLNSLFGEIIQCLQYRASTAGPNSHKPEMGSC